MGPRCSDETLFAKLTIVSPTATAKLATDNASLEFLVINLEIFIQTREIGRFSVFLSKIGRSPAKLGDLDRSSAKCPEFLPSSPYRARSTSLASSGVDRRRAIAGDATQGVYLYRPSGIWHMVRTPILPLSPGRPIFSFIRRNIPSFWDEYFISLMFSCDVDIASTRRLASACRSLSHSTSGFLNVVGLSRF